MLAAGVDYRVDDTLLVGVIFGAGEGDADLQDGTGGIALGSNAFSVGPIAGLRYSRAAIDGHRQAEAGPLNMTIGDQIDKSMIGRTGLSGATRFESGF